jgi:putative transcriptional regulator
MKPEPWSGNEVLYLRKMRGLTTEGLARKLGVSYVTVSRWENGHNSPSPLACWKLEKVLRRS